jgi:hypothetical protein
MRKPVIALSIFAVVAALVWWLWPTAPRAGWVGALAASPAGADRYSWTDWAGIRSALHDPAPADIEMAAYDADLLETTALRGHSDDLAQLGLSLNDIDSELLVQSTSGGADILRLDRSVDPSTWKGWTRSGPYWVAPTTISLEVFAYVQVIDGTILVAADNGPYLKQAVAALHQTNAVPPTVSGSSLSAFTFSGAYACSHITMANSGNDDQASAQDLIARSGGINPITSFTLARTSASDVTVRLGFENDAQARSNADARSALAVGPAPGMGGAFTDRFSLAQVTASQGVVTMHLTPAGGAPLMGELATGPVVFESC